MKIMYITPAFQHPKVRGPNRHYHFIRELSQRHEITLLTLDRSEIPMAALTELTSYTEKLFVFDASRDAYTSVSKAVASMPVVGRQLGQSIVLQTAVQQMKATFQRLMANGDYDVVLFHGKSVFPVIKDTFSVPTVTDFCDATSMRIKTKMGFSSKAKVPLLSMRYRQIRQLEREMVAQTPHLAFISYRDREAILGPHSSSEVIPNGIDLEYWKRRTHHPQPNCLVFTGVMNYAPNEDAALYLIDEILPLLKPQVPDIEIIIAGRDPTPALLERGRRHPEVEITGFVDDMRDYLERATVFAAPLRYASGMQNKIQEAFAMELPVVTTSVSSEGLRLDGQDAPLYVGNTAQQFAQRVVELLGSPDEQTRLASEGRQFAEKFFVWSRSAAQLEKMCFDAIGMAQGQLETTS